MTREEAFKTATEKHKKEIKEKAENKNRIYSYEDIAYTALNIDEPKVIRIIGLPVSIRNNNFSPKLIQLSMIRGDNDKLFRCIWPMKSDRPDWIMWKILNLVLDYTWDSSKNAKIFKYADTHSSIFDRVHKNGKPQNVYEKGWFPPSLVIMNIIDRSMQKWHEENKHTILLSKRSSTYQNAAGETIVSYLQGQGIPIMLYNLIMDDIVEHYGDWENYDIAITKLNSSPFYKVDNLLKHKEEFPENIIKLGYSGFLTPEEEMYEKYDLDKLFKITSYQKIYKKLKLTIQQIDSSFNTNFLKELENLVGKEKEEYEEREGEENIETESTKEEENIKKESGERKVAVTRRVASGDKEKIWEKKVKELKFLGIDSLNDEEKAIIIDIGEEDQLQYNTEETQYHCGHCNYLSPSTFHNCPKCGSVFT